MPASDSAPLPDSASPADGIQLVVDHPSRSLDTDPLWPCLHRLIAEAQVRVQTLTIVFTDHATVRDLNRTYLAHDYDTDVLSFSLTDAPDVLDGEVYVDLDTAAERHGEFAASYADEAYRYALHGTLHLVGHDDATAEGRAAMRALEDRYLR